MADIFAPKTSFNIGYERVVSQPVEDKRGETQAKFQAMANQVQASAIRAQTQVERAKMGAENAMIQGYGKPSSICIEVWCRLFTSISEGYGFWCCR